MLENNVFGYKINVFKWFMYIMLLPEGDPAGGECGGGGGVANSWDWIL